MTLIKTVRKSRQRKGTIINRIKYMPLTGTIRGTWKKELDELKLESAGIKHDLAENDVILREFAEIMDKVAMVQRAKAQQNEILPNLGEEKSKKEVSVQKRKHQEEIL